MPIDTLTEDLLHETPEELGKEESIKDSHALTPELLRKMNAYWRAANYVSVGQIYLYDNPLLKEPTRVENRCQEGFACTGATPQDPCLLASREFPVRRPDLSLR